MTNKPMLSVELLPCPHCGLSVQLTTYSGAPAIICDNDQCNGLMGGEEYMGTAENLVANWNLRRPPPKHQGEPEPCSHEWNDDGEYLLVCTACGAQEDNSPGWRDMSTAPRDGTMLRLLVEFEEHPTEDEDQAPTIGANNFDNDDVDEWKFSGWCWTHDHFVQGKGVPVGWLPMLDAPKVTSGTEQPAPVAVVMPKFDMQMVMMCLGGVRGAVLTSNQCHALAQMLNACSAEVARLNGVKP